MQKEQLTQEQPIIEYRIQDEDAIPEIQVTELLHFCRIPANIKGYQYLRSGIVRVIDKSELTQGITKQLYPDIAKEFKTTSSSVERAIRHAIEVAWERGAYDVLNQYLGCQLWVADDRPTNSEFIATIADYLRLKIKHNKK